MCWWHGWLAQCVCVQDGWGGVDAESVLWEEIRLMAQWESIGRIQIPVQRLLQLLRYTHPLCRE